MMASSIAVARAMDMAVTAEGVETQAQADMVRTAGCDQIQGWYYFKAITAQEIGQQLTDRRKRVGGRRNGHVG
jgi:EAL domain-containing protein (putative c-di-GMP-specific phosphodiesterase class I)